MRGQIEKAHEMTLDELMDAVCESAALPSMARIFLPSMLSGETKKTVVKLKPKELGSILKDAIDQVDSDSVESMNVLVRKALK